MKIASIITFLLSIAPYALTDGVPAERFKIDLDQINKDRAYLAKDKGIGNMHEVRYDVGLAQDAMKNLGCKIHTDKYLLFPDKYTFDNYSRQHFYEELTRTKIEDLKFGWTTMQRAMYALYDPRQSKIGCADIKCEKRISENDQQYLFNFIYTCAVEYPITNPEDLMKKGEPGSQCPKEKTKNNMCVGPPIVPPKPGSSQSSGSSGSETPETPSKPTGSSSSQLAPFIFIALLVLKCL